MGYWGVVMQDPVCELRRIPIPRTPVNKPPMVACLEFLVGQSDVLLSYSTRDQS